MSALLRALAFGALLGSAPALAEVADAPPAAAETGDSAPAMAAPGPAAAAPAGPPAVRSLDELLARVRAGSARSAAEEREREIAFLASKDSQQAALESARAELAAAREQAAVLERQWEENQKQIAERQAALRERLGTLAQVFAELGAAGGGLRARLHEALTAAQFGAAREQALDELLAAAASGDRLPAIGDFDALWYELQRELAESGRVRRFDTPIATADGRQVGATVVRVGNFNAVAEDGSYLLFDPAARLLQALPRQPGGTVREDAAALFAGTQGERLFSLDPGGVRDPAALVAAANAATPAERLRDAGVLGWLAVLLGLGGAGFAAYRLACLHRDGGSGELAPCFARLEGIARERPALDAIALEIAMDEAVLRELPALTHGLVALRAIGTLAPLLGVLGTVVMLSTGSDATLAAGADVAGAGAGDLAQALLSTVLGLCAGIPVLALQALLTARAERLGQQLDEHAAALVSARAAGDAT